jgi:hypothetical protein
MNERQRTEDIEARVGECSWLRIANIQRLREIERGVGIEGTQSYENLGCYQCDGHKKECPAYQPITIYRKEVEE